MDVISLAPDHSLKTRLAFSFHKTHRSIKLGRPVRGAGIYMEIDAIETTIPQRVQTRKQQGQAQALAPMVGPYTQRPQVALIVSGPCNVMGIDFTQAQAGYLAVVAQGHQAQLW